MSSEYLITRLPAASMARSADVICAPTVTAVHQAEPVALQRFAGVVMTGLPGGVAAEQGPRCWRRRRRSRVRVGWLSVPAGGFC
jgi:hypothetical protein